MNKGFLWGNMIHVLLLLILFSKALGQGDQETGLGGFAPSFQEGSAGYNDPLLQDNSEGNAPTIEKDTGGYAPLIQEDPGGFAPFLEEGQWDTSLVCSSVPGDDQDAKRMYFGCSCSDRDGDTVFSLAQFASDLDSSISDRNIIINLRDCWSLTLLVDEDDLYKVDSPTFRPDLFLSNIFIENIVEVYLRGRIENSIPYNNSFFPDYVRMGPASAITVTLYDVERVYLQSDLNIDLLKTETPDTVVAVELLNGTESKVRLRGFTPPNILVAGTQLAFNKGIQDDEFLHVLSSLEQTISSRSTLMAFILAGCVCIVSLGVGAAIFAVAKRNQYLLQAVVYASGDFPGRREDPETSLNQEVVTTTTKVNFFPKYSVVQKENLSKEKKDKIEEKGKKNKEEVKKEPMEGDKKAGLSIRSKISSISNLIYKSERFPVPPPPMAPKDTTSFYFQTKSDVSNSSHSDLTVCKPFKTTAQVHCPPTEQKSYSKLFFGEIYGEKKKDVVAEALGSQSPRPLIDGEERKYSFLTIREKCRKLISFHNLNTRL